MDNKREYNISTENTSPVPDYERKGSVVDDRKGIAVGEAAEIFGDVQTAEEYGYVERGLKSRHIQFIALGGTIGYDEARIMSIPQPLTSFQYRSLSRYRCSLRQSWTSFRPTRLLLHWYRCFRYDAVLGRDGHLAPTSWRYPAVLRALC